MSSDKQLSTFRSMCIERYWRENDLLDASYNRAKPPKDYKQRTARIIVAGPENTEQEELNAAMTWLQSFKGCGPGRAKFNYDQLKRSITLVKMSTPHHKLYGYFSANPMSNIDDAAKELDIKLLTAKYQAFDLLRVQAVFFRNGLIKARSGLNVMHDSKRGLTCELESLYG